jgi:hypothetical protein
MYIAGLNGRLGQQTRLVVQYLRQPKTILAIDPVQCKQECRLVILYDRQASFLQA